MSSLKKDGVVKLLKKRREGLTIVEISNSLGISRITSSIVLAELKGENRLNIREVGRCKLHYLKDE
jgi:predicted transcriptional regulator